MTVLWCGGTKGEELLLKEKEDVNMRQAHKKQKTGKGVRAREAIAPRGEKTNKKKKRNQVQHEVGDIGQLCSASTTTHQDRPNS